MKTNFLKSIIVLFSVLAVMSCGKGAKEELSGAGATFPLPFYNVVFENFNEKQGSQVAYGAIGSGGGIRNLKDGIVDFAGSDAFVSDKEAVEMPQVIHIPTCMGAVVVAYNVPGVNDLTLSGQLIAEIFSGKVRKWNDEKIVELNPAITLPDAEIIPAFRSDGSGTTFVFTDYLSKVDQDWAANYGRGKSVNFPVGQAAKGNPGVAGFVSQTANSIGYIGSEYAFAQKIPYASVINPNGEVVKPTAESISASASGKIPADTRTMITDSKAKGAYPISCFTWIVLYKEQNYSGHSREHARALVDFLQYIISNEAQSMASKVHYAPLPAEVVELSKKNLKTVTYKGSPLL